MSEKNTSIKISVIVPTYNRSKSLALVLKSISQQTLGPRDFEVLIVDNGSTDSTRQVSEGAIDRHKKHNISYILEPIPGLLSGRHRGALDAKGEFVVFIDDDIIADPVWLEAILEAFEDPEVQIVGGRNLPRYQTDPPEWLKWFWRELPNGRMCGDLSLLDLGEEFQVIDANYVWGLNFSIRKKALFDLGGFHPDCIPKHLQHFQGDGETGLTIKANENGYMAVYQPRALVYHEVSKERMSPEYFDSRYFYQGVCNSYTDFRRRFGKYKPLVPADDFKDSTNKAKAFLMPWKQKFDRLINAVANVGSAEQKLRERFNQCMLSGYNFHQQAVESQPKLLDWVLRDNYWDYKLPDLEQ